MMFTPPQLARLRPLQAIPYYPKENHTYIAEQIYSFASDEPQYLDWLVNAAVGQMKHWMGIAELRGIWCKFHRPADGMEADSSIPGYAPDDGGTEYLIRKQREIEAAENALRKIAAPPQKALPAPPPTPEEIEAKAKADRKRETDAQIKRYRVEFENRNERRRQFYRRKVGLVGKEPEIDPVYPDAPDWLKNL